MVRDNKIKAKRLLKKKVSTILIVAAQLVMVKVLMMSHLIQKHPMTLMKTPQGTQLRYKITVSGTNCNVVIWTLCHYEERSSFTRFPYIS